MSRSIDLFLDSDLPLERLGTVLDEIVEDATFRPAPDGSSWSVRWSEGTAQLSAHDYFAGRLPLDAYPFVLSCSVAGGTALASSAEAAWLRRVAAALRSAGWPQTLLVLDLQRRDGEEPPGASAAPASTPPGATGEVRP